MLVGLVGRVLILGLVTLGRERPDRVTAGLDGRAADEGLVTLGRFTFDLLGLAVPLVLDGRASPLPLVYTDLLEVRPLSRKRALDAATVLEALLRRPLL